MNIVKSAKYSAQLRAIVRFIALDSPPRARLFKNELEKRVMRLDNFPYKYRASIHFKSKEIRDMIYKGYVVPYFIDRANNKIVLIGIAKYKDEI